MPAKVKRRSTARRPSDAPMIDLGRLGSIQNPIQSWRKKADVTARELDPPAIRWCWSRKGRRAPSSPPATTAAVSKRLRGILGFRDISAQAGVRPVIPCAGRLPLHALQRNPYRFRVCNDMEAPWAAHRLARKR